MKAIKGLGWITYWARRIPCLIARKFRRKIEIPPIALALPPDIERLMQEMQRTVLEANGCPPAILLESSRNKK